MVEGARLATAFGGKSVYVLQQIKSYKGGRAFTDCINNTIFTEAVLPTPAITYDYKTSTITYAVVSKSLIKKSLLILWRDARAVEWARLESV